MPKFDFTLCLRMYRGAAHMAHLVAFNIFRQFTCDIAETIVAEQPGLVLDRRMITALCC